MHPGSCVNHSKRPEIEIPGCGVKHKYRVWPWCDMGRRVSLVAGKGGSGFWLASRRRWARTTMRARMHSPRRIRCGCSAAYAVDDFFGEPGKRVDVLLLSALLIPPIPAWRGGMTNCSLCRCLRLSDRRPAAADPLRDLCRDRLRPHLDLVSARGPGRRLVSQAGPEPAAQPHER